MLQVEVFVLLVVAHHLLEQCPKDSLPQGWRMIEVVRGGGDGQMFSKESFKANNYTCATEWLIFLNYQLTPNVYTSMM